MALTTAERRSGVMEWKRVELRVEAWRLVMLGEGESWRRAMMDQKWSQENPRTTRE
jgi:hypothetical protein